MLVVMQLKMTVEQSNDVRSLIAELQRLAETITNTDVHKKLNANNLIRAFIAEGIDKYLDDKNDPHDLLTTIDRIGLVRGRQTKDE